MLNRLLEYLCTGCILLLSCVFAYVIGRHIMDFYGVTHVLIIYPLMAIFALAIYTFIIIIYEWAKG